MIATRQENKPFQFHVLANEWPLMTGKPFEDLVDDIRKNGLNQPISINTDNEILDGRNRFNACMEAGIEPRFEVVTNVQTTEQIEAFIASKNLHRRHQSKEELATIVEKMQAKGKSLREIEAATGIRKSTASRLSRSKRAIKVGDESLSQNRTVTQQSVTTQIVRMGKTSGGGSSFRPPRRLTAKQEESIKQDLIAGHSIRKTAKKNEVSLTTVKRKKENLLKSNSPLIPGELTEDQTKELVLQYESGVSPSKLVRKYKVTKIYIMEIIRDAYRSRHPSEMIEHLRSLFDPSEETNFCRACDNYQLSSELRRVIEDYFLHDVPPAESVDKVSIDIESLNTIVDQCLQSLRGRYSSFSKMSSSTANKLFVAHSKLLCVQECLSELTEIVQSIEASPIDAPLNLSINVDPERVIT